MIKDVFCVALQQVSVESVNTLPVASRHPSLEGMIPYREGLVERAKQLRKNSTYTEVLLWKAICRKRLGIDFVRQKPLLGFIVDFYCKDLRLAIEIDEASHDDKYEYDLERETLIKQYGVSFLRFSTQEILNNLNTVLTKIRYFVNSYPLKGGVARSDGEGTHTLNRDLIAKQRESDT